MKATTSSALKKCKAIPKTPTQIALAVKHLHSFNIAHRDLKPENLLYKSTLDDSPIKLCDFGFAKQDKGDLTTPQFTPYYVSPQVLEAQRRHRRERSTLNTGNGAPYTYDKSCDMWSLGVIIYILMCGYPPFYSEHPTSRRAIDRSMRRKIMSGTYQLNEREWERVSPQAKDVVKKLLCVDPAERLTIDGLVQHAWLTEEAPDTLLQSPLYISNKAHMKDTSSLYKSQQKKMRTIDRSANLKPIEAAINPMLVKRQQYCRNNNNGENGGNGNGISGGSAGCVVVEPHRERLQPLRDIIALCLFGGQRELGDLVETAVHVNAESEELMEALKEHAWNGGGFDGVVDKRAFAYAVKDVVDGIKSGKN